MDDWVRGKALETVKALRAIEPGDEIKIEELDDEFYDKRGIESPTQYADGRDIDLASAFTVEMVYWDAHSCPVACGEMSFEVEEIVAWRRPRTC